MSVHDSAARPEAVKAVLQTEQLDRTTVSENRWHSTSKPFVAIARDCDKPTPFWVAFLHDLYYSCPRYLPFVATNENIDQRHQTIARRKSNYLNREYKNRIKEKSTIAGICVLKEKHRSINNLSMAEWNNNRFDIALQLSADRIN